MRRSCAKATVVQVLSHMYLNIVGSSAVEQVKTKAKEITVAKSKRAQTIQ